MIPIERIERRIYALVRLPGTWGEPETVEMVALALLDVRSDVGRSSNRDANVDEVRDLWRRAVWARHDKVTTASHSLVTGLPEREAYDAIIAFVQKVRAALPLETP
jgi:hypothetical protein